MTPILAIDYGTKHMGLAISDELGISAAPLAALQVGKTKSAQKKLADIVKQFQIKTILIGLPVGMHGKNTQMSLIIDNFAQQLEAELKIPVIKWNETYTSQEAAANIKLKKGVNIHSESARIILQSYLDHQASGL